MQKPETQRLSKKRHTQSFKCFFIFFISLVSCYLTTLNPRSIRANCLSHMVFSLFLPISLILSSYRIPARLLFSFLLFCSHFEDLYGISCWILSCKVAVLIQAYLLSFSPITSVLQVLLLFMFFNLSSGLYHRIPHISYYIFARLESLSTSVPHMLASYSWVFGFDIYSPFL